MVTVLNNQSRQEAEHREEQRPEHREATRQNTEQTHEKNTGKLSATRQPSSRPRENQGTEQSNNTNSEQQTNKQRTNQPHEKTAEAEGRRLTAVSCCRLARSVGCCYRLPTDAHVVGVGHRTQPVTVAVSVVSADASDRTTSTYGHTQRCAGADAVGVYGSHSSAADVTRT